MNPVYSINRLASDLARVDFFWKAGNRTYAEQILDHIGQQIGSNYLKKDFLADIWKLVDDLNNTELFTKIVQHLKLNRQQRTLEFLARKYYSGQSKLEPPTLAHWNLNDTLGLRAATEIASKAHFERDLEKLEKHRSNLEGRTVLRVFAVATAASCMFTSWVPALCMGAAAAGVKKLVSIYQDLGNPPSPRPPIAREPGLRHRHSRAHNSCH